jgi:hypothetical protein
VTYIDGPLELAPVAAADLAEALANNVVAAHITDTCKFKLLVVRVVSTRLAQGQ